jgi:hypothetical protein
MKSLFIFMVLLISGRALMAQTSGSGNITLTLPTVALLDIHPAGNISMNFSAPTEAGNPLGNPTSNNTKWLNYTSAVSVGNTRIITASVNQMIPGINIRLQAGAAAGSGGGARGTSAVWLHSLLHLQRLYQGLVAPLPEMVPTTDTNSHCH